MYKVSSIRGRSSFQNILSWPFFLLLWPRPHPCALPSNTTQGGAALGIVILEVRAVTFYPTLSSPQACVRPSGGLFKKSLLPLITSSYLLISEFLDLPPNLVTTDSGLNATADRFGSGLKDPLGDTVLQDAKGRNP